jgi:hypothetical protein
MESISGVPAAEVGRVVQDYIDDGAAHIAVQKDADGTFTVYRTS